MYETVLAFHVGRRKKSGVADITHVLTGVEVVS